MINKSKLNELLRADGFCDGHVELVMCDGNHNSIVVWFDHPSGLYQVINHLGDDEWDVVEDFDNKQAAIEHIFKYM